MSIDSAVMVLLAAAIFELLTFSAHIELRNRVKSARDSTNSCHLHRGHTTAHLASFFLVLYFERTQGTYWVFLEQNWCMGH